MNNIDKMFKNKLEHLNVDVPDGAWDNISSRLPQQKQPYRLWWTIVSAFLLFLVSYLGYYSFNQNNNKIPDTSIQVKLPIASDIKSNINNINEVDHKSWITSEEIALSNTKNIKKAPSEAADNKSIVDLNNAAYAVDIKTRSISENIFTAEIENTDHLTIKRKTLAAASIANELNNKKLKYSRAITFEMSFIKDKQAKACPFNTDYQDKSADVYFSHDFPMKSLTSVSSKYDGYKNMRQQTEKTLYSFSAGARFGYNLSYKWNLHTGFNYSQINEKFEYIDPESNQTRIITIKDYVYTNGKITDSIVTEEQVIIPGTTKLKVYNTFKSFDIPVIGRYTLLANKKLSLSAMAGVYFNISFIERGMILDSDNSTPISITGIQNSESKIFKSQLGLSGYGAISMAYHLTSSLDFLLEPNARFQTESMTTGDYPLRQHFNTFGISTGLRFKF